MMFEDFKSKQHYNNCITVHMLNVYCIYIYLLETTEIVKHFEASTGG